MKKKPRGSQVIAAVKALAKKYPENQYTNGGDQCLYADGECTNGRRGCLIGQALHMAGIPRKDLKAVDKNHPDGASVEVAFSELGIRLGGKQLSWLVEAQDQQDNSIPWGGAVEAADDYVKRNY